MLFTDMMAGLLIRLELLLLSGGGKPLGRLERQGDVGQEPGLVELDRQNMVAAAVDDRLSEVGVGGHRIGGHHGAPERKHAEQLQRRLMFVGFDVDAELSEHFGDLRGIGRQQMHARGRAVGRPARRLAVDHDLARAGVAASSRDPNCQGALERGAVKLTQEI